MTIPNIVALARFKVNATPTSFTDANLLIQLNVSNQEIVSKIIANNKNIHFDDQNHDDQPYGDFNLQNEVATYSLGTDILSFDRLEVKDISGKWHKLSYLDQAKVEEALDEYKKTPGLPTEYTRRGNSFRMFCPPSSSFVTLTGGGRIYYQRLQDEFATADLSDSNKTVGHYGGELLAYKIALPYAEMFKKDRVPLFLRRIEDLENTLFDVEGNKNKDKLSRLIPNVENTR